MKVVIQKATVYLKKIHLLSFRRVYIFELGVSGVSSLALKDEGFFVNWEHQEGHYTHSFYPISSIESIQFNIKVVTAGGK